MEFKNKFESLVLFLVEKKPGTLFAQYEKRELLIVVKVLIIERDKKISQSLSFFIENQLNYNVVVADSKKEGESLYHGSSFDMVICGDPLPDGEALELLKGWMSQNPKLFSILMTVKSDEHLREEALRAGVSGYLVKPFDLEQLEELIGGFK